MAPAVRQIKNWAPKVDVDNRIALRYYYRIAGNLLKQATIYRGENNLIDLYAILLRFSGLLCETIPSHQDYRKLLQKERSTFQRKLLEVVDELETLKPVVQRQLDEFNQGQVSHFDGQQRDPYSSTGSMAFPAIGKTPFRVPDEQASFRGVSQNSFKYSNGHGQFASPGQTQTSRQIPKSYLSLPYPKEETLSRHSILGPDGLSGQWNGPITGTRVQYPSNADILQIDQSSLPPTSQPTTLADQVSDSDACNSDVTSVLSLDDGQWPRPSENSSLSIESVLDGLNLLNIKEPSVPPVLADVKPRQAMASIPPSKVADPRPGSPKISDASVPGAKTYQHLHIPVQLMECFLSFAEKNTAKNVETCGILAGSLKDRRFCVTTLIIPKQEGTPDSCQTTNEEEIFDYQDQRSLFPLGWIHTHPTQTCFMSSIDLHTHYSYQIMLPEAIAIVMAPTDRARKHGIFNLSDPGGISVIRNCQARGFHPHEQPSDGSPLYEHSSHVYMNPNLKFESVDLR